MKDHAGEMVRNAGDPSLEIPPQLNRRAQQFTLEQHARWLGDVRPAYVLAHPTLLAGLMDVYEEGGIPAPPLDILVTFAETVSAEFRKRARSLFGAKVVDRYSCEEAGPMAFQCPESADHYHISSTNVLLELLDEAGGPTPPGSIGRVFVTNLHNWASPVVRYELGDLASWQPQCVCGHSHPVLTSLLGRKRFLVRLPSGERKYVSLHAKGWVPIAPIREFRIVQVSEGVIHAEFVLDRPMTPDEREAALARLQREISPDLTYKIIQLDRIDWGPSYKRQDIVSLV
jgi:phenylacetate-CoA ligase